MINTLKSQIEMKKMIRTIAATLSMVAVLAGMVSCDPPTEEQKENLSELLLAGEYMIEKVQVEDQVIWEDTEQVMVFDLATKKTWIVPFKDMSDVRQEAMWEYNVNENTIIVTYIDEEVAPELWQDSKYEIVDFTGDKLVMKDKDVMQGNSPWVWYLRRLTDADYACLLKSITFTNLDFYEYEDGKYEANPRSDLPFTVEYAFDPEDYVPYNDPYWTSSNENVAVVSSEGVISLPENHVNGETEITMTCDGVTAKFTLKLMLIN